LGEVRVALRVGAVEHVGRCACERRLGEAAARACANDSRFLAAAEEALALAAPKALVRVGLIHHAEQRCAVLGEADQGAPQRLAEEECACAVDRVDDPTMLGVGAVVAELFTDDAVGGVSLSEHDPDGCFGIPVCGGDGIENRPAFMVNGCSGPKMRQYDRRRPLGEDVRCR
jgi:hypothetical protein